MITVTIFIFFEMFIYNVSKVKIDMNFENKVIDNVVKIESEIRNEIKVSNENNNPSRWELEIPKINLKATIAQGTTDEILNKYIGHFIESEVLDGNIALAAHNRGYDVNYFSKLKELEIGDTVYYYYENKKKEYIVASKDIIKDTDFDVIENTKNKDNILTLITCVENMPELRRCIRCIEVK